MNKIQKIVAWAVVIGTAVVTAIQYVISHAPN